MSRGRIWERLSNRLDLDSVSMPGVPLVELYGGKRVLIENHCGVMEYTDNMICVKVKCGQICVSGHRLNLTLMSRERLVICGCIESVQMKEEQR